MAAGRLLVVSGFAFAFAFPAAAAGVASPQSARTIEASSSELLTLAQKLAERGERQPAERILVLLGRDPSREVRNEARYRHSLLLESAGSINAAAVLLRTILDEQPDAAPIRLKLAIMLYEMGEEQSAFRELRALRSADLPPSVARFVDRISGSLHASKPFGFQLELALAPDSNVNRASRSDTLGTIFGDFAFDDNAKRKSGVGAAVRAAAHRRLPLGRDISLVARATTDLNLYRASRFNDISAEVSAGPEFRLSGTRFTADAGVGQRWYGMTPHQRQLRLSASATRALTAASQIRLDATIRASNNLVNDQQDGRGHNLRARYERSLSPQLAVSGFIMGDRFLARDDAYSTRSWTAGIAANRDFGRVTLSVAAEFGRLKADERLDILPRVRRDTLKRLSVGAVFRQFTMGGFAPLLRVVVERNSSSVEFYDYKRTRSEFGVSRAF